MKKFRFKFATVLDVRKMYEQTTLVALGAAQRAYQAAQQHKLSLQQNLKDSLERREQLGQQVTSIMAFRVEQDFITGTKQRIIQADQGIMRASRGVEKALRAYILARKQSRMIEVLEEKARAEHKFDENKKEMKQMDELNIMRSRLREEIA